jgi:type IV pilus assembly protein PilC
MPATRTFSYEGIDTSGKRTRGTVDASNETAATQSLRQQGLVPLAIAESRGGILRMDLSLPFSGRTSLKDLAVFSRQFATMSSSGMSLLRSLAVLEEQTTTASLRKAIGEVRTDVQSGVSLSGALGRHDRVFPTLMVAMVRAGEAGGFLDDALERIAVNFEKDASLRAKIKGALTYPVIVLAFSLLMITGVLLFIVPVFEKMFADLGGQLPLPTRIIVAASHSLVWFGPLLIGVVATGTTVFRRQLRQRPTLRLALDRLKLRLPVFGPLFTKLAVSRFSRNLGTLLGVGVPLLQSLSVVGETSGNSVITDAMGYVQNAVRSGDPMSTPLARHAIFPKMVVQMIEVGEESGQISQMLDKIADFYDGEVDAATESLTAALEPIMILLMGAIVGTMVICLYLPMFSVYQNIQGVE